MKRIIDKLTGSRKLLLREARQTPEESFREVEKVYNSGATGSHSRAWTLAKAAVKNHPEKAKVFRRMVRFISKQMKMDFAKFAKGYYAPLPSEFVDVFVDSVEAPLEEKTSYTLATEYEGVLWHVTEPKSGKIVGNVIKGTLRGYEPTYFPGPGTKNAKTFKDEKTLAKAAQVVWDAHQGKDESTEVGTDNLPMLPEYLLCEVELKKASELGQRDYLRAKRGEAIDTLTPTKGMSKAERKIYYLALRGNFGEGTETLEEKASSPSAEVGKLAKQVGKSWDKIKDVIPASGPLRAKALRQFQNVYDLLAALGRELGESAPEAEGADLQEGNRPADETLEEGLPTLTEEELSQAALLDERTLEVEYLGTVQEPSGKLGVAITINGHEYHYGPTASNLGAAKARGGATGVMKVAKTFKKLLAISPGRALVWLKNNAIAYAGTKGNPLGDHNKGQLLPDPGKKLKKSKDYP